MYLSANPDSSNPRLSNSAMIFDLAVRSTKVLESGLNPAISQEVSRLFPSNRASTYAACFCSNLDNCLSMPLSAIPAHRLALRSTKSQIPFTVPPLTAMHRHIIHSAHKSPNATLPARLTGPPRITRKHPRLRGYRFMGREGLDVQSHGLMHLRGSQTSLPAGIDLQIGPAKQIPHIYKYCAMIEGYA